MNSCHFAFFQHEETGGCVQTFFGNKPPSKRFSEITEEQYKMWLANQSKSLPTYTEEQLSAIKIDKGQEVWYIELCSLRMQWTWKWLNNGGCYDRNWKDFDGKGWNDKNKRTSNFWLLMKVEVEFRNHSKKRGESEKPYELEI